MAKVAQLVVVALVAGYPLDVLDVLDVLDAETEGMVGYLLEQELGRHLPTDRLATLLTQVVVDPTDPAFANPTKPIGPVYTEAAAQVARERGGRMAAIGALSDAAAILAGQAGTIVRPEVN